MCGSELKTGVGIEPTLTAVQAVANPVCYPVMEDIILTDGGSLDVCQRYSMYSATFSKGHLVARVDKQH